MQSDCIVWALGFFFFYVRFIVKTSFRYLSSISRSIHNCSCNFFRRLLSCKCAFVRPSSDTAKVSGDCVWTVEPCWEASFLLCSPLCWPPKLRAEFQTGEQKGSRLGCGFVRPGHGTGERQNREKTHYADLVVSPPFVCMCNAITGICISIVAQSALLWPRVLCCGYVWRICRQEDSHVESSFSHK